MLLVRALRNLFFEIKCFRSRLLGENLTSCNSTHLKDLWLEKLLRFEGAWCNTTDLVTRFLDKKIISAGYKHKGHLVLQFICLKDLYAHFRTQFWAVPDNENEAIKQTWHLCIFLG